MDCRPQAGLNVVPVLLYTADTAPGAGAHDDWVAIDGAAAALADDRRKIGLGQALEAAFDATAETWLRIGREMGAESSAAYAHTPACAANVSDFGLMLAWSSLVDDWAAGDGTTLVVCDDPWMFRHLAARPGVTAGPAPGRLLAELRLAARGYAARAKAAVGLFAAALKLGRTRRHAPAGKRWLLVYGHPSSNAEGNDGYFGDLMTRDTELFRLLHVDCPPARVRELGRDDRSFSLHAWGMPLYAATLPFRKWRPGDPARFGGERWLVHRARCREGASGQAALIAWQHHCQERWLARRRPAVVAWPWENHAWERHFVRAAKRVGARTIGYQHSVIGRQMLNYAPASNPDGLASIPEQVLCTGAATLERLAQWGLPTDRLAVGGALRVPTAAAITHRADAPVFAALPFDGAIAEEMVAAMNRVPARHFVVKDHPMTPFKFSPSAHVQPTARPLAEQPAVSAVLYAATTVGLEAVVMGLPTLRFRPAGRLALDILPAGISVPATDGEGLAEALSGLVAGADVARERVFAEVDLNLWKRTLSGELANGVC